jgi:predicted DNA-binding transcriptional regulator AlpA
MPAVTPKSLPQTYLKSKAVCARYGGVSLSWIARRTEDSGFPPPTRFGPRGTSKIDKRERHWPVADLDAWDAAQRQAVQQ